jgi:hypothetical protein
MPREDCPLCLGTDVPWRCDTCHAEKFPEPKYGPLCDRCERERVDSPKLICDACAEKEIAELDARMLTGEITVLEVYLRLGRLRRGREIPPWEGSIPCYVCKLPVDPAQGNVCKVCRTLALSIRQENDKKAKREAKRERHKLRQLRREKRGGN